MPRALGACRFGVVSGSLAALLLLLGCGVVTSRPHASADAGAFGTDGSSGSGSGENLGSDAASSCHATDVSTYVPLPYQHATPPSPACLSADGGQLWDTFFGACLGGPEEPTASCNTFKQLPSNAACASCILTLDTADPLGPIINYGQFVGGNVAGCIELTAPNDVTCANAIQALAGCELKACEANCPVTDAPSLADREACAREADANGCHSYFQTASSCRAAEADAGLAGACMAPNFKDFYEAVVPIFCGYLAGDAAAEGDAAAADAGRSRTSAADGGEPRDGGADGRSSADASIE